MKKIFLCMIFLLSFSVVDAAGCEALLTRDAAEFIGDIVTIVRIGVPILLVVLCSTDFVAIVTGQDESVTKKSISRIVKRFICAAAFFFVPLILQFILGLDVVNNALNLVDDPSCGLDGDLDGYKTEEEIQKETEKKLEEERKKKEEEKKKKEEEEKKKKEEEEKKKQEENNNNNNDDDDNNNNNNNDDDETPPENPGNNSNYPAKEVTKNISKNYYKSFTYYLYLPDKVTKNLPIVMYMGGTGERGNDYSTGSKVGMSWGPIHEVYKYNYSYNAIIVVPQVPSNQGVYNYINDYISLLNELATKYGANKKKISAMGFSHGCYGMVNLISAYPKYFSAAVFVGCAPNKKNSIKNFTYQPVWTFVGSGDGTSDYSDQYGQHYSLENFTKEINKNGGNAKHTYAKKKAHNIFNDTYSILRDSDYNVINWMIKQSK